MASRRLVLPEALGPTIQVSEGSNSRSADSKHRKSRSCSRSSLMPCLYWGTGETGGARSAGPAVMDLQPHRHDHVAGIWIARLFDQAAGIGVRQRQLHGFAVDGTQGIEQVGNVEADLQLAAVIVQLQLLFRLLLLWVVRLQGKHAGAQGQADASILLVGKDRGAAQGLAQRLAVRNHFLVPALRN